MFVFKLLICSFFFFVVTFAASAGDLSFKYNGFRNAQNLHRDGMADIIPEGILRLTNTKTKHAVGHCFYSNPIQFNRNSSSSSANGSTTTTTTTTAVSFSTTFVFAIVSESEVSGQGFAFVIAPTRGLPGALGNQFLGLFNVTNVGESANHIFAVELDTSKDVEYDKDNNHVGININGLKSAEAKFARYYTVENGGYKNLLLKSGRIMQVWVEYDGSHKQINVTIAPIQVEKPDVPLLSFYEDLSTIFLDTMYVGFSSSTRTTQTFHYILGWSFQINGDAQDFELSSLPKLPKGKSKILSIVVSVGISIAVLTAICTGIFFFLRKRKFAELVEDWEKIYGTHRFTYKDLYMATNGFAEKEIIGSGALVKFAVKKVSHDSSRGMQQFIAEIVSIGKLRHRNLVQLYGYCRRKGELLLLYEFFSCGSLEKFIFPSRSGAASSSPKAILNWTQRFEVIKGVVASGLVYLHEEWEKVVIHRDVKASNVLLDVEMNPRLGDFGLAMIAGTPGYIAPEMTRSGFASTSTDVYSFGVFLLEVVCGKRPVEIKTDFAGEHLVYLVDRVLSCWRKGTILETIDPNLKSDYVAEEIELALKLGLLCTHTNSDFRPTMRQVMQYLNGNTSLLQTDLWALDTSDTINQAFALPGVRSGDLYPYGIDSSTTALSSATDVSAISGTR
ncbi:hypothetical protein MKW98_011669 [Papaver atlanticum]|uniref:non-specific serine/threonine protein kinase n=1 Tax=Papaver atlanticum TaxID=357466 RepID=A0AAD4S9W0_9MAGN|nr:hypothetical protein MKW98_011669 [Papaver atlanticum]